MIRILLDPSSRAGISSGTASPMSTPDFADDPPIFNLDVRPSLSYGLDVPGVVMPRVPKEMEEHHFTSKLCVIMVGLPARGKSYIVKKLRRYLNWLQYETRIFNVGNRRRLIAQTSVATSGGKVDHSFNFFDPQNTELRQLRDDLALESLEELIDWLKKGEELESTMRQTARMREAYHLRDFRKLLQERLEREPNVKVLFIESICNDKHVLEKNMRLKLSGPDYQNKDHEEALKDFRKRVENYEKAYEPIEDSEDIQYCKLIDVGKKIISYKISGFLSGQVIFYMHNFNLAERQIFISRHGESMDNQVGKIGGDAPLSPLGRKFGKALKRFTTAQRKQFRLELDKQGRGSVVDLEELNEKTRGLLSADDAAVRSGLRSANMSRSNSSSSDASLPNDFSVWTSILQRTIQTVEGFDESSYDIKHVRLLNEICAGPYEGMTYQEIQNKYPEEFQARERNKLFYRYPGMGGESYVDVIHRLQPLIVELERMTNSCLIVTHRVVMRILLGYFLGYDHDNLTHMHVPLHTVYELRPKAYGTELNKWRYLEVEDDFVKM